MNISNLIEKLLNIQNKNGSFLNDTNVGGSSIFLTSQLLHNLKNGDNQEENLIAQKIIKFLFSQASQEITFNFHCREISEKYPDNLATTFCALTAIAKYDKKNIDGSALSLIISNLVKTESDEGGPYFSFYPNEKKILINQHVDIFTNILIGNFLKIFNVNLEKVDNFIEKKLINFDLKSDYSTLPQTIYWLSSYLSQEKYILLKTYISRLLNSNQKLSRLDMLYIIASLINIDQQEEAKKYFAMLKISTITEVKELGLCYEIMQIILINEDKEEIDESSINYQLIIDKINLRLNHLEKDLSVNLKNILKKIISFDKDKQIALLSFYTKQSLGKNGIKISNKMLLKIGQANIYMWMAYTIYDDFYDDEGMPHILPSANFCLREAIKIITEIMPDNSSFHNLFSKLMDKIDAANTFETTFCRAKILDNSIIIPQNIPDYDDISILSNKSLAHSWCAFAPLFCLGFDSNSHEVKSIIKFFVYYLSAKQLNDDAHDWEEDLSRGHITSIVADIIKKSSEKKYIDIKKDILPIREKFWLNILTDASFTMLRLVDQAKNIIKNLEIIENKNIFYNLLDPIVKSAEGAIHEQKEFKKFIENFKE